MAGSALGSDWVKGLAQGPNTGRGFEPRIFHVDRPETHIAGI